jgi:hypothetical protein
MRPRAALTVAELASPNSPTRDIVQRRSDTPSGRRSERPSPALAQPARNGVLALAPTIQLALMTFTRRVCSLAPGTGSFWGLRTISSADSA